MMKKAVIIILLLTMVDIGRCYKADKELGDKSENIIGKKTAIQHQKVVLKN